MDNSAEYLFLRPEELNLLLFAAGKTNWFGPEPSEYSRIENREDFNRILADLYQQGLLTWESDHALLVEPLTSIVQGIQNAETCIVVWNEAAIGLQYAYPCGNRVVQLNVDSHGTEKLRMTLLTFSEWITLLEEESCFPECIGSYPDTIPDVSMNPGCILEMHDCISGETLAQMMTEDRGMDGVLYVQDANGLNRYPCDSSLYVPMLRKWMTGGTA